MILNRLATPRLVLVAGLILASLARADAQALAIVINDSRVFPESLTSARDGSVFIGSIEKGVVYRAAPGATRAETWIARTPAGLLSVLGVLADDRSNTLWVCSSPMPQAGGTPVFGDTMLVSFELGTGLLLMSYTFPGGGLCNDIAVAPNGTVYASDTPGGRILRLKPRAKELDVWTADPLLASIDGIALLADGSVYANTFRTGYLVRIPVRADGSAGQAVKLDTSRPLVRPDGMRAAGPATLLLVEGEGRLDAVTVSGAQATVRVVKDSLPGVPTAVTQVRGTAFVLDSKLNYRNDPSLMAQDPGLFEVMAVPYSGSASR